MAGNEEKDWLERARAGDVEAFGALVLAHQQFVYNLAWRALGDEHEAQDAAQEAFLRVWQALPNFRGQAQFRTWLYRIVTNVCYGRLLFQQKNAERYGWDLGPLHPVLSGLVFFGDVATLHRGLKTQTLLYCNRAYGHFQAFDE